LRVEVLVEAAAQRLSSGESGTPARADRNGRVVLWHDPCQLGRGLGIYEAPRAVLTRVLGRAPGELTPSRDQAVCSGAGGLLPSTMPAVARAIARARLDDARRTAKDERDGRIVTVVTGCASSLMALRKAAAGAHDPHVEVEDVVSYVARACSG
jgi:Fe-S oxidoreductase